MNIFFAMFFFCVDVEHYAEIKLSLTGTLHKAKHLTIIMHRSCFLHPDLPNSHTSPYVPTSTRNTSSHQHPNKYFSANTTTFNNLKNIQVGPFSTIYLCPLTPHPAMSFPSLIGSSYQLPNMLTIINPNPNTNDTCNPKLANSLNPIAPSSPYPDMALPSLKGSSHQLPNMIFSVTTPTLNTNGTFNPNPAISIASKSDPHTSRSIKIPETRKSTNSCNLTSKSAASSLVTYLINTRFSISSSPWAPPSLKGDFDVNERFARKYKQQELVSRPMALSMHQRRIDRGMVESGRKI